MPPFSAPVRLIAGHIETLNVKQVLKKIWIEMREDVRNLRLRVFDENMVGGASLNRNSTFKMFEGQTGCDTKAPLILKSPVHPRLTRVFSAI